MLKNFWINRFATFNWNKIQNYYNKGLGWHYDKKMEETDIAK